MKNFTFNSVIGGALIALLLVAAAIGLFWLTQRVLGA